MLLAMTAHVFHLSWMRKPSLMLTANFGRRLCLRSCEKTKPGRQHCCEAGQVMLLRILAEWIRSAEIRQRMGFLLNFLPFNRV